MIYPDDCSDGILTPRVAVASGSVAMSDDDVCSDESLSDEDDGWLAEPDDWRVRTGDDRWCARDGADWRSDHGGDQPVADDAGGNQ